MWVRLGEVVVVVDFTGWVRLNEVSVVVDCMGRGCQVVVGNFMGQICVRLG